MTWVVSAVPPSEIKTIWPVVAPLLQPAIEYSGGRIDMRSVFEWLTDGRYLLWVAYQDVARIKAAFVTRVATYPRRKILAVDLAGGSNLNGWLEEVDKTFRAFSRQSGLSGVELYGRPGWARALRQFGWRQSAAMVDTE